MEIKFGKKERSKVSTIVISLAIKKMTSCKSSDHDSSIEIDSYENRDKFVYAEHPIIYDR